MMKPTTELLERCRKDDRKAHYELYHMCFPFLVSVCRRYYINVDDVQSSLNFIFLKIVRGIGHYLRKSDAVPFELWSRRIAINFIIDEFRKNSRHRENLDYRDLGEEENLHPSTDPFGESEKFEEILAAIEQLSVMNRTVFNLFVVDGYGHEEIGKMLKISSGTSKAHLHNARKRLKELLQQDQKKKVIMHNSVLQ
jgi:RNA polymerase sigma-70 factor (ECF subfamily)